MKFKYVEAKNFLSFGNKWTKIPLHTGLNLVVGYDKQKQRSNGAGKTSFVEMISFGLFGVVAKGLKKAQIINWKNKKGCEVKVTFEKNDSTYLFHRGIKPDFLKVFKDGAEYPINSSVKEFQKELEEQILGLDFKVFNSLIYSNPNNSISLLDTPKAQKRVFIEKQFNLTEFSALNKLNNEIIKKVELEKHDIEKDFSKNLELIQNLTGEKQDIEKENIVFSNDLNTLTEHNKKIELQLQSYEEYTDTTVTTKQKIIDENKNIFKDKQKDFDERNEKKQTLKSELITIISTIAALKKQKEEIGNIVEHLEKLTLLKEKLNGFIPNLKETIDDNKEKMKIVEKKIDDIKITIKNAEDQKSELVQLENQKEYKINTLDKQKREIGDITEHLEKLITLKENLISFGDIDTKIDTEKTDLKALQNLLVKTQTSEFENNIIFAQNQIKAFNIDDLKGKSKCPTCHSKVDYDTIKKEIDSEIRTLNTTIEAETEKQKEVDENIEQINNNIEKKEIIIADFNKDLQKKQECEKDIIKLEVYTEKQKELGKIDVSLTALKEDKKNENLLIVIKDKIKELNDSLQMPEGILYNKGTELSMLEDNLIEKQECEKDIIKLEVYTEKQKELNKINSEINKLSDYTEKQDILFVLSEKNDILSKEIEGISTIIESLDTEMIIINQKLQEKGTVKTDLETSVLKTKHKQTDINKNTERIVSKNEKLMVLSDENNTMDTENKEKQIELDHFMYIKEMLKDENIKQFAISNMIPIIEKQVNYYLGESGFGFYLKLDNWLDAEIKGPGITNCSFASMSGGERKSIDLALKFAIMDISTIRIANFPDLLILDELLDSSVDSFGIESLINIIRVKQQKENLKVFVISHRSEISELKPTHTYKVTKDNNYSSVEVTKG